MTVQLPGPVPRPGPTARRWALVVLPALVVVGGAAWYGAAFAAAERTLYRADQLAYWSYTSRLADDLRNSPWSALEAVADSVAHSDVNLLPALPIAALLAILGDGRASYLLAVILVYGGAVALALGFASAALRSGDPAPGWLAGLFAAAAMLLLPTLWRPVLIGYLGLGGVAICLLILGLYFAGDPPLGEWRRLVAVGMLLALLALFRRWYTLWAISFGSVVVVDAAWLAVRGRLARARAVRAPLLVGATGGVTALLLAAPVVVRRLEPGYGVEFVAFEHHATLAGRLAAVAGEFGLLPLAVVAAAAAVLIRRPRSRRIGVLLPLQAVLTYLLMIGIQDHSPHHWYLYLAVALLLVTLAGGSLGPGRGRVAVAASLVGLGAIVSASVFAAPLRSAADMAGPLLPRSRAHPAERSDLAEVGRLLGLLDRLTAARPGYIYVLGCSATLSEQTLAFANRSLGTSFSSPPWILQSAHVDRRDGFPRLLLEARYVVVPDPVQVNMRPEHQRVVVLPTEEFLAGSGIARAFERLPDEFRLEGDVRVWVFRRIRSLGEDDIRPLSDALRAAYPDEPRIWRP